MVERARNRCEYCLIHQDDAVSVHQIDHIIAEKHGGNTVLGNLALACRLCNLRKGSDLSTIDPDTGDVVTLFNPRRQKWIDHFRIEDVRIEGLSPEGRTTVAFLQLNSWERTAERRELALAGRFPPPQNSRD